MSKIGQDTQVRQVTKVGQDPQARQVTEVGQDTQVRASQRRSREGQRKAELATIPYKFSFVLHPDEGKYHWLKNDVPEIKVDW